MTSKPRRTVAILGASGFIGSWLTATFLALEWNVRTASRRPVTGPNSLDSSEGKRDDLAPQRHSHFCLDLSQPESVRKACDGAELVVIVVASRSSGSWRVGNAVQARHTMVQIPSTVATMAATSTCPPDVIFAGSVSQGLDAPLRSDYQHFKQEAEDLLLAASRSAGFNATSLRLSTVYGPRRSETGVDHGLVSALIAKASSNEPLPLWNDGTALRDLLYVEDAVAAFVAAADNPAKMNGCYWDVVSGTTRTVHQIFEDVANSVAGYLETQPVTIAKTSPPESQTTADSIDVVGDHTEFARATGWKPSWTWPHGLAATTAELLKQNLPVTRGAI